QTLWVFECDWYPLCSPTTLEQWTVDVQVRGDFVRQIDDSPADFTGSLAYSIYYPSGAINLGEVVPLIVDADAPITAALTSLADGQYVRGDGATLIVGGVAQDPTSNIASVEVSVNNGAWEPATGAESWAYAWQSPAQAGAHTFRVRAADVVGHVFTGTQTTVIADAYPPDVNTPIANGAIVTATENIGGRWSVALYGAAQDRLEAGGAPGSGVRAVQALLEGADQVAGQGWQTATLTVLGGSAWDWRLDYLLPALNNDGEVLSDPSGVYTFVVRAVDHVGNQADAALGIALHIDATAPVAALTTTGPSTTTITQSLTLAGVITDPGPVAAGLSGLEIAYTPQEIAAAISPADADMLLHLDEVPGATTFRDAVNHNHASCAGDACPTAGESGVHGSALRFDGVDDYLQTPNGAGLKSGAFTLAAWIWWDGLDTDAVNFITAKGLENYEIHTGGEAGANGIRFIPAGYPESHVDAANAIHAGWNHVAVVYTGEEASVYMDGSLVAARAGIVGANDLSADTAPFSIGRRSNGEQFFDGLLDEVVVLNRALSAPEIEQLYAIGADGRPWLNWHVATLSASGAGVTHTTWSHVVPADLAEGVYQIDLRGSDVLGNRNADASTWTQWKGEIDLASPRLQAGFQWVGQASDAIARTEYTCAAEDFNLVEASFDCPCPTLPGDRQAYDAEWFRTWVSDTAHLYRIETSCIRPGHQPTSTARVAACDRYGHCSETTAGVVTVTHLLDVAIFTPTHGAVLTTTAPVSIAGGVYAGRADGLKALTVTVDSDIIYTATWTPGASSDAAWETAWLTPTAGVHTLRASAADQQGYVLTDTRPILFYVDSEPPAIALPTGALTTAHRLLAGQMILTGPYTETGGVAAIQVQEPGGAWGAAAVLDADTWRYAWFLDGAPNGVPYTLTARITDVAGRTAQQTGAVIVDVATPQPVTVTLAYTNSLGVYTVVTPGDTIRDVLSPTLIVAWTASQSSDLARYYAGWTTTPAQEIGALLSYSPSDRRHAQVSGEAQAYYAHVVGQDVYGNRTWQTVGPIYTDVPTTSDYIADLSYRGWMESGCAQIGADRELVRYAQTGQALTDTQRLYTTWSTDTLRLTWTGADWNNDGDLFIYFDTAPGGATAAYNPYAPTPAITLPIQGGQPLEADFLIWVQDADTAALLTWNGVAWDETLTDTLSGPPYYQLDTTLHPVHTDLAIPFDWLSITVTTPVKMVALASEEGTLRLWAAMPDKNPLNSGWAINTLAEVETAGSPYALTQYYAWDALAPGLCPNAGQFTDADLLVELRADPPGVEVGYLADDLLFLTPGQPLDANLDGRPDAPLPMETNPTLIGEGMVVTYTVRYANAGTDVAPDVVITATARGAVALGSDPLVIVLGDVGAGVTATRQFTGVVDTSVYTASGEVLAIVSDATHGPFDWLWVQHGVDQAAPERVEIEAPLVYIQPYTNTAHGAAYDPSGVSTITLHSRLLPFGLTTTATCADATPQNGQWACNWSVGDARNGDRFTLQAWAMDRFGNGPTGSALLTLTVDTLPPTITLDLASENVLQGAVLGPQEQIVLSGQVADDQRASSAEICITQTGGPYCEPIALKSGATTIGDWSYALKAVGRLDYLSQTLALTGIDGAGNRSTAPLSRTYTVDNVAPAVTVTTWLAHIPAGISTQVLGGTVRDGGGDSQLYMLLTAPGGTLTTTSVTRDGENWQYTFQPDTEGVYSLRIEARDAEGNVSGYGPYVVTVGGTKVYLPLVLRY
ncbi:MAG TPA: hypothetical protein PKH77_23415, partial [Anaerolineae bacterium]|nr:hypothetical protein [Anaerolineae bacterium]